MSLSFVERKVKHSVRSIRDIEYERALEIESRNSWNAGGQSHIGRIERLRERVSPLESQETQSRGCLLSVRA